MQLEDRVPERHEERHEDLLSEQREANEELVLAALRAHEQTDDALEARRRAEGEIEELRGNAEQDKAVRALFDLMPQLGWAANPDGWIYYYNQRWYEYTGKTPSQMEGWGWESVHDPALLPRVTEMWKAAIASGEPFEASFPLLRHDGVFRWFITRAAPMRNDRGEIVRWVGSNTDIDDLRQAEQAIALLAVENAEAFRQAEEARVEEERQRMLRTDLFMTAPTAIGLLRGPELVIEFANPAILEVWGRTSSVIGKSLFEVLPEIRGQVFEELLHDVMRTGQPFVGNEMPAKLMRGGKLDTVYFNFGYAATRGGRGEVDGVSIFAFDVTSQVLARRRATLVAAVGRSLVADVTLTEQLVLCCEGLATLGTTSAIWVYNGVNEMLELRASARIDAQSGAQPTSIGIRKRAPRGQSRSGYLTNAAIGDARVVDQDWATREGIVAFASQPLIVDGRLVGVVEIFAKQALSDDILATLNSVADPIALGIERDNSERFRELFIGMLGHDLRNPLNAVSMAAHVLLASPTLGANERRTTERVKRSALRMTRMISQILDFTRARSGGGIPISRTGANLHEICAQIIEELKAGQPHRTIETEYLGNADGAWDIDRLAQVLSNIIGNALFHGAPDAPVRVAVDATGTDVRCCVRNRGVLIDPELLLTLFDPFRRSGDTKTVATQGLGLGLFISHQIMIAHGGTITACSTAAEGTEFTITLPRGELPE